MATTAPLEARELTSAINSPEIQAQHDAIMQGRVRTRFPPEPNGYLHIGHAKSLHMNFSEAFEKLGVPIEARETYFRYDDTNPEAESQEYVDAIAADVYWLGYSPVRVTHSSDYFDELYELAVKLIKKGRAYVCHQTKNEIEASRTVLRTYHGTGTAVIGDEDAVPEAAKSPYRNRSIDENLKEFEKMRVGLYDEGAASLRMKMDLSSPNPNMWDHVAYRIKYVPHPLAGNKWVIYPTYDYTHCIVDALEHIDYSICTLEFETRRESYYWLLHELDLYKPKVYEFARLAMTYTVLSKRKLLQLVNQKTVRGWDDPRMGTLSGLRRRGFSPSTIRTFCGQIGVTRVQSTIEIGRLYAVARAEMGPSARRVLAVLDPVEVIIENYKDAPEDMKSWDIPNYPADEDGTPSTSTRKVLLTKSVYLDRSDIRQVDVSGFYGVAPGKCIRLKYAVNFTCSRIETEIGSDKIQRVFGTVDWNDRTNAAKPKGVLTWTPSTSAAKVEVRVYHHLFTVPDFGAAMAKGDVSDWQTLVDAKHSEIVHSSACMDPESLLNIRNAPLEPVQFERIGYFIQDKDSTANCLVMNQIVPLREDAERPPTTTGTEGVKADGSGSRKAEQEAQLALKMEKMKLSPLEMFKTAEMQEIYSQWTEDGLPSHYKENNEPLTKNALKKLKKEQSKQAKLHETYLKNSKA